VNLLSWVITALTLVLLVAFIGYLFGLRSLPTAHRPRTRTFDRYGDFIEERENPDYHENPGEIAHNNPDIIPAPAGQDSTER
jgi:hypothetical protein